MVDGVETAVGAVADKGGVSLDDLMSHAFVRETGLKYTYRSEMLTRFSLRRKTVMVCPMCLAADIAASSREAHVAAYGRALWQIDAIKTCLDHGISLVAVADDRARRSWMSSSSMLRSKSVKCWVPSSCSAVWRS